MPKVVLPLDRLLSSTRANFPNRFANAVARLPGVSTLTYTPFPGVSTLSVRGDVEGAGDKSYKVIAVFSDVSYSDEKDEAHTVPMQITKTKKMWIEPIGPKNRIAIRCACDDFYYVFSYYDWQKGCLYGPKARPYKRKTTTYPERNPAHVPGICKHLISCWTRMRRAKYFKS